MKMRQLIPSASYIISTYRYKPAAGKKQCIKIVDLCSNFITFSDNSCNLLRIDAQYMPFWGYDIYAEILADYYNSSGLNINTSRRQEYYEEAKSLINPQDFIRFCNYNKNRWQPATGFPAADVHNLNNSLNSTNSNKTLNFKTMDWHKIKNKYHDTWYELIDFLADPGIYRERRIRIEGNTVVADTKEDESDDWYEIDTLHQRDLYEFFEQRGIFVVILYDEWIGFFSYEIYSKEVNEVSPKFESRKEAETAAFMKAFAALEEQIVME